MASCEGRERRRASPLENADAARRVADRPDQRGEHVNRGEGAKSRLWLSSGAAHGAPRPRSQCPDAESELQKRRSRARQRYDTAQRRKLRQASDAQTQ